MQIDIEILCRYHYDPLDRLIECTPSKHSNTQRFYQKDHLITELQETVHRSIMQYADCLLAQQHRQNGSSKTTLLAIDQRRSVLNGLDMISPRSTVYSVYGYRPAESGLLSVLGFNGERRDQVTGYYFLGNGYRAFNPVLMRFNSPDNLSPFDNGGLNAYAYCAGDPVNRSDPSGHMFSLKALNQAPRSKIPLIKFGEHGMIKTPGKTLHNASSGAKRAPQTDTPAPVPKKSNSAQKVNFDSHPERTDTPFKPGSSTENDRWTFVKDKAAFKELNKSEQEKLDIFQNAIHNEGNSYQEASQLIGNADLKRVPDETQHAVYQIRLGYLNRARFSVEGKTVKLLQAGGHI